MSQRSLNSHKNGHRKAHHNGKSRAARPIRSGRDYARAAAVVDKLRNNVELESVAELRLQALIHEMEKFDDDMDDFGDASDFTLEDEYDGPLRRWSDDPNDLD